MNIIKPPKLKTGDTIGIIATSGPIEKDSVEVSNAVKFFKSRGFNVLISDDIYENDRYLAGSDDIRLKNLHEFFKNDDVNAIICLRGGYGAIRLVNKIDYELIRNNPKIFCGYSDITALNLMLYKRAGLVTYSGPMIMSDFGREDISDVTICEFFNSVSEENQIIKGESSIITGEAEGILWGGNLSTIVSLGGLDFVPDEPFIFFTEDVSEPVYKLDKMFNQLLNIEKFRQNIRALCFGEFTNTDKPEWLNILFEELAKELNIPTAKEFKFSHEKDKTTVPIGAKAKLKGNILYIE